jgi:6-pyruvoyltetrahydropterin/6-carboxytetrahydropterin synthase
MLYQISTTRSFSAAHQLTLYDGALEPIHGHNWRVKVTVSSPSLDSIGVVMDFHHLERLVDAVVTPWHNNSLNAVAPFANGLNPSAENVALSIARTLDLPRHVTLVSVEVHETDTNSALYLP